VNCASTNDGNILDRLTSNRHGICQPFDRPLSRDVLLGCGAVLREAGCSPRCDLHRLTDQQAQSSAIILRQATLPVCTSRSAAMK
jgi:hypothetical protein